MKLFQYGVGSKRSMVEIMLVTFKRHILGDKTVLLLSVPTVLLVVLSGYMSTAFASLSKEFIVQLTKGGRENVVRALANLVCVSIISTVVEESSSILLVKPLQNVYRNALNDSLNCYLLVDYLSFNDVGMGKITSAILRRGAASGEIVYVILIILPSLPSTVFFSLSFIRATLEFKCSVLIFSSFLAITILVTAVVMNIRYKFKILENEKVNLASNVFNEVLINYDTVRAFNCESFEVKRYDKKLADIICPSTTVWCLFYGIIAVQKLILYVMDVVIIALAVKNAGGTIPYDNIVGYIVISLDIKKRIRSISRSYGDMLMFVADSGDIYDLPEVIKEDNRPSINEFRNEIEFNNVGLSRDGKNYLDGLTFKILKGDKIAIVGSNGSGKSTFFRVLMGFYDYSGSIKIDGAELNTFNSRSVRNLISFVPQESSLMSESVRNNILYGIKEKRYGDIFNLAAKFGAHSSILRLKSGYDTNIGERGRRISGGEQQKISILRAAIRDRDILILDEPTANMDTDSESKIFGGLVNPSDGKTVLVITHNHNLLNRFDKIIVFQNGKATMYNTYEEFEKSKECGINFYNDGFFSNEKANKYPCDP